jgi:hypothetical protein
MPPGGISCAKNDSVSISCHGLESVAAQSSIHGAPLREPDPLSNPDRLAVRVGVPGGAGAWRELDAARAQTVRLVGVRCELEVEGPSAIH